MKLRHLALLAFSVSIPSAAQSLTFMFEVQVTEAAGEAAGQPLPSDFVIAYTLDQFESSPLTINGNSSHASAEGAGPAVITPVSHLTLPVSEFSADAVKTVINAQAYSNLSNGVPTATLFEAALASAAFEFSFDRSGTGYSRSWQSGVTAFSTALLIQGALNAQSIDELFRMRGSLDWQESGSSRVCIAQQCSSRFTAFSGTARYLGLSQTAVPEPSTWLMLIAGFGSVGYTIRRKRATLQIGATARSAI